MILQATYIINKVVASYSSHKKYNRAFLVLKDTYNYFKNINEKERAIQAVVNAQNDKRRWIYAFWQMKANLIYDMRHDDDSWFDKFSREDRGQAVLDVLESAWHKTEFSKIISELQQLDEDYATREAVKVRDLIEDNQTARYNQIKIKFSYVGL